MQPSRIEPLLSLHDIISIFDASKPTIFRWLRDAKQGKNDFPLNVPLPGRKLGWTKSSIEAFLARTQPVDHLKIETSSQTKKRHAEAMQELSIKHGIGDKHAGKEVTAKCKDSWDSRVG